jgi:nascent polypeptide-associated complex subunit alpha
MLPGNLNPRQMQMLMKRLGMATEPVPDVEEVIVRTRRNEHVIRSPEVTILTVQGVRTYQVVGDVEIRARTASVAETPSPAAIASTAAAPPGFPEEDVQLVMEQAGVDREAAEEALRGTDGAPAEAILRLLSRRGGEEGG